jgi:hypothetical protein
MTLRITVEQAEGPLPVTILVLDGELDASSYEHVIDAVRQIYDAGGRLLLMDLSNLEFISSSGLVAIFLEPHAEHFIRFPTSGTGKSEVSGSGAGSRSRSRPHSRQ